MSIVGPRPALYNQYDLIEAREKVHANDVRPGLTGLAQVNGRDELPIDVKAAMTASTPPHVTFGMDVSIFFRTIAMCSSAAAWWRAAPAPWRRKNTTGDRCPRGRSATAEKARRFFVPPTPGKARCRAAPWAF